MAKKPQVTLKMLKPIPAGKYERWVTRRRLPWIPKDSTQLTKILDMDGSDDIVNMSEVSIGDYIYNKGLIYAMNMNVGRSIPWIEDGLKSVERRVLYMMWKNGLYGKKSTKVASIVGAMIEKVYPHGDQAAGDTIYRLGRSKSMMIPYIQELSNYGNLKDLKPAATRYAEASLSAYAMDCFFGDVGPRRALYDEKDTYEYTDKEPIYLISRYPNILMQWNQGIGKGASSWLGAFNSTDIFNAALKLMDNPNARIDIYPDAPVPVEIVNTEELRGCFDMAKFKVHMRAPYHVEVDQRMNGTKIENKYTIVFTALPLNVTGDQVYKEVQNIRLEDQKKTTKRLPEVINIEPVVDRHSDGGIQIIVEYEYGYDPHVLAEKLYKSTSLGKMIGVKYSLISDYKPEFWTPRRVLLQWIQQRYDQKRRYYQQKVIESAYNRAKYEAIATVLATSDATDKAIYIIRHAANDAESIATLRKEFNFTEFQCRVILSIEIRNLQKMDIKETIRKRDAAKASYKQYRSYLSEESAVKEAVRAELKEGLKKYGRKRMAVLTNLETEGVGEPNDSKFLLYNNEYYFCYETQVELAAILPNINNTYRLTSIQNADSVLVFTRNGMLKILNGYAFNKTCTGVNMKMLGVEDVVSIMPGTPAKGYGTVAMVTEQGYGKLMDLKEVAKSVKSRVINLNADDYLADVIQIEDDPHIETIIGMTQGDKMYYLKVSDFPRYKRSSAGNRMVKGVKGLKLERMVYLNASDNPDYLLVYGESGYMKLIDASFLTFSKRGNNTVSLQGKRILGATLLHGVEDTVQLYYGKAGNNCVNEVKIQVGKMVKFQITDTGEEQRFKMSTSIGTPVKVLKVARNEWYDIE